MGNAPEDGRKTGATDRPPPELRYLKTLVTTLTVVMIAGLLTMIALFVTRLPGRDTLARLPPLPESITLPDGTRPEAFTRGRGWIGIVTDDDRLLIYDATTGALRQSVQIETRP